MVKQQLTISGKIRINWVYRLCNMALESCGVKEDWKNATIISLYIDKRYRIECENYRGISLLSVVEKIYARSGSME